VNRGEVSKIQYRTDLYLSMIAECVEALGWKLEIRAVYSDREVRITRFEETEVTRDSPWLRRHRPSSKPLPATLHSVRI
jgi:hypothetical protein